MNRLSLLQSGARHSDTVDPAGEPLSSQGHGARVVLLTMDFPPNTGGVQQYLMELCRRIGRHCRLTVVYPQGDASLFQKEPFDLVPLPSSMPWHFASVLARLRPQITILGHAHPRMLLPAAMFSWGRYIAIAHSSDFEVAQLRWHSPFFNRLLARARPLVTVSRNSAQRLKGFGLPAPQIVFPGADPPFFFLPNFLARGRPFF